MSRTAVWQTGKRKVEGDHEGRERTLAELKSQKVKLCIGSDCHSAHYEVDFEAASLMLDNIGIKDEDLWRLPPRSTALLNKS